MDENGKMQYRANLGMAKSLYFADIAILGLKNAIS